jgi:hypothetical protein
MSTQSQLGAPVATFWDGMGVWMHQPQQFDPDYFGRLLKQNGWTWVALKIHHRLNENTGDARTALDNGWAVTCAKHGIVVGGWGVNEDAPEREANLADKLCYRYKLKFYIADAEGPHKGDWPGGNQRRSDVFVKHFRKLRPRLPLGFSTFGAGSGDNLLGHCLDDNRGPMHFSPWYRAGAHFLPQAYPNEFGEVYEPVRCMRQAVDAKWPIVNVEPVIGIYSGWHAPDYAHRLIKTKELFPGFKGFSSFTAESMREEDYEELTRLARKYNLATIK